MGMYDAGAIGSSLQQNRADVPQEPAQLGFMPVNSAQFAASEQ